MTSKNGWRGLGASGNELRSPALRGGMAAELWRGDRGAPTRGGGDPDAPLRGEVPPAWVAVHRVPPAPLSRSPLRAVSRSYVYGKTLVPEVEGGPRPTVHMLWTPVPRALTLRGEERERSWEFLTAVAESEEEVKRSYSEGLSRVAAGSLHSSHVHAWAALWRGCCVELDGPLAFRQALCGCLYYLLSTIPPQGNPGVLFHGISPGGLSNGTRGEDYWGHVFWDQVGGGCASW